MKKYTYSFWAPLINFHSTVLPIVFNKNIQIRKATSFEKKEIISRLHDKWINIQETDLVLDITIEKTVPEQEPRENFPEARKELEKMISILRLFRSEPVGYNLIVQKYSNEKIYAHSAKGILHYVLWATSAQQKSAGLYKLIGKDEVEALIGFFNEFLSLRSWQTFELAIAYFNKSYIEPYTPRDSFLDIMVCLENLYLKDSNQELSYKLAMRMAHHLATDERERKNFFKEIQKAYGFRSKIVHGSEVKIDETLLLNMRQYARKSLKWFLKHSEKWSESSLNDYVLENTFFPHT